MRVVLIALLMLAPIPACAEWLKVGGNKSVVYYIDPATILREGNLRRVSTLTDLKSPGMDGELSRQSLDEYNCNTRRRRILSFSSYSGPMGAGNVLVRSNVTEEWNYLQPGTAGEIKFKSVCR